MNRQQQEAPMPGSRIGLPLALIAGLGLAACSEPAAPGEDAVLDTDIAMVAAHATLEAVGIMATGDPRTGPFTRTRSIQFFDAAGREQARFDPETTDRIRTVFEMSGEVTREGWSASVSRTSDLTVSGLAGRETTRTWDGTGSERVSRSRHTDAGGTRSYEMTANTTIAGVVVPVHGTGEPWPLSGSITHVVKATLAADGESRTRERTVVVTFDGTRTPSMTVNGEPYALDLGARPGHVPFLRPKPRR
jgi:hypothetical protein